MTVRWRFTDPVDSSIAYFDINPDTGGSPELTRNINAVSTVAAGGTTVIYEGSFEPATITFSGTILTENQLNIYQFWFTKLHQVELLDDLGRITFVMMTKFDPKRVRFGHNFWRHTFTATLTVVNWP